MDPEAIIEDDEAKDDAALREDLCDVRPVAASAASPAKPTGPLPSMPAVRSHLNCHALLGDLAKARSATSDHQQVACTRNAYVLILEWLSSNANVVDLCGGRVHQLRLVFCV